jgi:hypothetical protein
VRTSSSNALTSAGLPSRKRRSAKMLTDGLQRVYQRLSALLRSSWTRPRSSPLREAHLVGGSYSWDSCGVRRKFTEAGRRHLPIDRMNLDPAEDNHCRAHRSQ